MRQNQNIIHTKLIYLLSIGFIMTLSSCKSRIVSEKLDIDGFYKIFNGKTLDGWDGDPVYWSVRNGSLFGEITPKTIVDRNTFIIWQGDMPSNFELKVEYKVSAGGNSGINYRSELVQGVPYALRGYQADLDGGKHHTGMNYEERKRTTLAKQGQVVTIPDVENSGDLSLYVKKNIWKPSEVINRLGSPESLKSAIKDEDWNEYHLIIKGNRLKHFVNGVLMSDVTDNDQANRTKDGLLGVQVHVGPPMTIEYRNFRIKDLD